MHHAGREGELFCNQREMRRRVECAVDCLGLCVGSVRNGDTTDATIMVSSPLFIYIGYCWVINTDVWNAVNGVFNQKKRMFLQLDQLIDYIWISMVDCNVDTNGTLIDYFKLLIFVLYNL